MPQTSVTLNKSFSMEGQVDESAPHFRQSCVVDETNGVPFGRAVTLKTAATIDGNALVDLVAGTSEAAAAFGVAARNPTYPTNSKTIANGDGVAIVRAGIIVVQVEDAVTAGSTPFIRGTAGATLTELGRFRSDDGDEGGGALAAARTGWEYLDSGAAEAFVRVWVK